MEPQVWEVYKWVDARHFPPPAYAECVEKFGREQVDRTLCTGGDIGLILDTRNQVLRITVHGYPQDHSYEVI